MHNAIDWSLAMPAYSAALVLGYLLGSIPFGLVLTRLAGTQDIRAIGSGNIGATNVLRTGRKGLAAATLVCDMLKGTAAVLLAHWLWGSEQGLVAGFGAFIGHLFPVWLWFKGGKGVATYIGVLLALSWPATLVFCIVWLGVAIVTRYSSLSALVASVIAPIVLWALNMHQETQLFVLLTALIFIKHAANIRRLANGTEGKIGQNSASANRAP